MTSLRSHTVLDHDASTVWQLIRDPGSITEWFPAMESSDMSGSMRRITFTDQTVVEEEVVTTDDRLRRHQYRVRSGDLPIHAHLGTVDVIALDAERSLLVYSTEIEPPEVADTFDGAIAEAVGGLQAFLDSPSSSTGLAGQVGS